MRKTGYLALLVWAVLVMGTVVGVTRFVAATGRERDAAVAKWEKSADVGRLTRVKPPAAPESVAAFEQLCGRAQRVTDPGKWQGILQKPEEATEQERAQVNAELAGMQELIGDIRRVAESGECPPIADRSKGLSADASYSLKSITLAELLSFDAWGQIRAGNQEGGVLDILAIMKIGHGLAGEPDLIAQVIRAKLNTIAYDTARTALAPKNMSAEQTQRLMECAGRGACRSAFTDGLATEGLLGRDAFNRVRQGASVGRILSGTGKGRRSESYSVMSRTVENAGILLEDGIGAIGRTVYGTVIGTPWRNADEAAYMDTLTTLIEASRLPHYLARPVVEETARKVKALPATRVVSRAGLPHLLDTLEVQATTEVMLDLMRIGLALDQYAARNGAYPPSLDAVAEGFGGRVPTDPFTGQPYCYSVVGDRYALYSVGRNLRDDGGEDDVQKRDIVWRTCRTVFASRR